MRKANRYRIYTEDKNPVSTIEEVRCLFPGFTVYYTAGFWRDKKEMSLVIEMIDADYNHILSLADWIKEHNSQESVMVTKEEIEVSFI